MAPKPPLSDSEKQIALNLQFDGKTIREIAKIMNRSTTTIHKFLKNPHALENKSRLGRPPRVDERTKRQIKRLAVNKSLSSGQIKTQLSLDITKRRVRQILSSDKNIRYEKMLSVPQLKPVHKRARLQFAERYRFWTHEWEKIIFSDEKKFNLDGPDGKMMNWRDTRRERQTCYARNFGGGTVMVWAAFGVRGKSSICFISTNMNSEMYIELLDSVLVDFGEGFWGNDWIFQQDNASIHISGKTKSFLQSRNIEYLDWPARSPDLNPIENLWGLLSNNVYKNGRQFETAKDLKKAIQEEWSKIDESTLQNLILSMPRRLNEVIANRGGHTHY